MTVVYPGRDPLVQLVFWTEATRITFDLQLMEGGWQGTRQMLLQILNERLDGMFDVLLGDENLLTDRSAQYVLYVEESEAEKGRAIIDYLVKN